MDFIYEKKSQWYITEDRVCAVFKIGSCVHNQLIKCYPSFELIEKEFFELSLDYRREYCKMSSSIEYLAKYIFYAFKILKPFKIFYRNHLPLLIEGNEFVVSIAPDDQDDRMDSPDGFKELTGCVCPNIVGMNKEKENDSFLDFQKYYDDPFESGEIDWSKEDENDY